jgi:adenylylsulfate kinase
MSENIVPYTYKVTRAQRQEAKGHRSFLVFFTGLSGSGKSTLCNALEERLHHDGVHTYVLDGDNIRKGINKNLGFGPEDRSENIRRIGEIAHLFIDAGVVVLAAFVAPYAEDREALQALVGKEHYIEVFVNTPLEICEQRDVKGLYALARKGEIKNLTGVSAPYEAPLSPDVEITPSTTVDEAVDIIYAFIKPKLKPAQ